MKIESELEGPKARPIRRKPSPRPKLRRVLIVDDDVKVRNGLAALLSKKNGYVTEEVTTLADAEQKFFENKSTHYDALILDSILPDGHGADLCAGLRRLGYSMPIMLFGASSKRADRIAVLDAGANDCITKPFKDAVLIARLDAQFRILSNKRPELAPTKKALLRQLDLVDGTLKKIEPRTDGPGHNNPPDTAGLPLALTGSEYRQARSAVATLRNELEARNPDRARISESTSSLGKVASSLRLWLAQKGEVASKQFATSFGKAAGTAAGIVSVGAAVRLVSNTHGAIDTLIGMLGRWLGVH
jgi:DNA-binding response OmpR family regulator